MTMKKINLDNPAEVKKLVENRNTARKIVKDILDFGTDEQMKLDIIYFLALNLEDNEIIKNLTAELKKYRVSINKDKETDNNDKDDKPKLIL